MHVITRDTGARYLQGGTLSPANQITWTDERSDAMQFVLREAAEKVQGRIVGRFATELEEVVPS